MSDEKAPTLKQRIEAADERASRIVEELQNSALGENEFIDLVHEYVRCKFLLSPEECSSDDIFTLAEASIEKLLRINDRSVKLAQGSNTCTNQSSTDIKKVLLSLSLQRAVGVKMTPEESANLETVTQLARSLYARRQQQRRKAGDAEKESDKPDAVAVSAKRGR